jgi:hypothetical protein
MIRFNFLNTHIACKRLSSDDNGLRFLKSQNAKECLRAFEISHDDRKMIKMLQHGVSLLKAVMVGAKSWLLVDCQATDTQ